MFGKNVCIYCSLAIFESKVPQDNVNRINVVACAIWGADRKVHLRFICLFCCLFYIAAPPRSYGIYSVCIDVRRLRVPLGPSIQARMDIRL